MPALQGPTTSEADAILRDRGVVVLPDLYASAGGVTVSFFEWVRHMSRAKWLCLLLQSLDTWLQVNNRTQTRTSSIQPFGPQSCPAITKLHTDPVVNISRYCSVQGSSLCGKIIPAATCFASAPINEKV